MVDAHTTMAMNALINQESCAEIVVVHVLKLGVSAAGPTNV